ncbi:MAG: hypothetical protein ACQXXD_06215 [Thermoplasmatota archaeon]
MPIEGIDDKEVEKKVETLFQKAYGEDEYYNKWKGPLRKLAYIFLAITLIICLVFFLIKDYVFENLDFQSAIWIIIILIVLGGIASFILKFVSDFERTKGFTFIRHQKEVAEALGTIKNYEKATGNKVRFRPNVNKTTKITLIALLIVGIIVLPFAIFDLASDIQKQFQEGQGFGALTGVVIAIIIVVFITLYYAVIVPWNYNRRKENKEDKEPTRMDYLGSINVDNSLTIKGLRFVVVSLSLAFLINIIYSVLLTRLFPSAIINMVIFILFCFLAVLVLVVFYGIYLVIKGRKEFSQSHGKNVIFAKWLIIFGIIFFVVAGIFIIPIFSNQIVILSIVTAIMGVPFWLALIYLIKELAEKNRPFA